MTCPYGRFTFRWLQRHFRAGFQQCSDFSRDIRASFYLERLADKRNSFLPILIVPSKSLSTAVPRTTYFLSPSVIAPRRIAPLSAPSNVKSPFLLFTVPVIFSPSCLTVHCSLRRPSIVLWIVTFQLPTILAGVAVAASVFSSLGAAILLYGVLSFFTRWVLSKGMHVVGRM